MATSFRQRELNLPSEVLKKATFCLICLCLPFADSNAQISRSAQSLGMADSYLLLQSNCEAATINPANLALTQGNNFTLKLVSVNAFVSNNAFGLSDYRKYNGAFLTEEDKREILRKIPTEGLRFDVNAHASAFSFSLGRFAFSAEAIGGGRGRLSKDPIELALMGNKVGQVVTADGSSAESWGALSFGAVYAQQIVNYAEWDVSGGVSLRYLRGLGYYAVDELSAEAVTLETGFTGEGGLTTLSATGGSGFAIDIGFAARSDLARLGFVVRNAYAAINWNHNTEKTLYNFSFRDLTIENANNDTVSVSDKIELGSASFTTRPPLEIEAGAAKQFGRLVAAVSLRQGFAETALVSKSPRLAGGVEYEFRSFLKLRSGLALGGIDKASTGIGIGLVAGVTRLDLAWASAHSLIPWSGNGGHLAIATMLEF